MLRLFVLLILMVNVSPLFSNEVVDWSLYLVITQKGHSQEETKEIVRQAVQGGVTVVQLQQEEMTTQEMIAFGRELHQMLAEYHVPLMINERIDVAKAIGAEGVHLLQFDPKLLKKARQELGKEALIGYSPASIDEVKGDPDVCYISICPMFPSSSHPELKALGVEGFLQYRKNCSMPILCVGGIRINNVAEAIAAGADGVVVVSPIIYAENPLQAAQEMRLAIEQAKP